MGRGKMTAGSKNGYRRFLACALAYALAVQGFLFALDIGGSAVGAANAAAVGVIELCSHSSNTSDLPGTPSHIPVGDNHCLFCIVGAVYVHCAPPGTPQYDTVAQAQAVWVLPTPELTAPPVNASAWPRGPPTAA